jgi:hypothetical protein
VLGPYSSKVNKIRGVSDLIFDLMEWMDDADRAEQGEILGEI